MILTVILLLAGLALIVFGADWLVDGASSVARRFGLSEFVIGLTIVGMGTSAPEMVVSFIGAFQGNADIAIGNVVGSNIFNTLLILGLTALILPMAVTPSNKKRDIPVNIFVTALLVVLGLEKTFFGIGNDGLSRFDGAILMAVFILYMVMSFKGNHPDEEENPAPLKSIWLSILMIVGGLAGLILGGNLFVDSATDLARMLGVSDKFIAVTILAGGTSLPELATSLVAALKGRDQLALGNILGSNVFNILLILGSSALITPLSLASVTSIDALVLTLSMILSLLWAYTGNRERIDLWEGILMLLLFGAYYTYLFINQ